jgi:DNA-binding transcriptional regulator YiaG
MGAARHTALRRRCAEPSRAGARWSSPQPAEPTMATMWPIECSVAATIPNHLHLDVSHRLKSLLAPFDFGIWSITSRSAVTQLGTFSPKPRRVISFHQAGLFVLWPLSLDTPPRLWEPAGESGVSDLRGRRRLALLEFPVLCAVFRHVGRGSATMKKSRSPSPRTPNWIDKHLADQMRRRRQAAKVTQNRLAQELGVSFEQVQKYERGVSRISAARLYEICQIIGVPIASMFEDLPHGAPALKNKGPTTAPRSKKKPPR